MRGIDYTVCKYKVIIGPAHGRYPIKFFLPEFVSYLGERGVLCVGNGSHFFTPDLIVWCGMSEICLKLKVLAKIDFIVFLTLLGVK